MGDVRLHDWSRTDDGAFHQFHSAWIIGLCRQLNNGGLPSGYGAHAERVTGAGEPDVLVASAESPPSPVPGAGVALLEASAVTATVRAEDETDAYLRRMRRLVIRRRDRRVVSVTEFVSKANKGSRSRFDAFLRKSAEVIDGGSHLSIVDVHRARSLDPRGMVDAVWKELSGQTTELDGRSCGAVRVGTGLSLHAEPMAVGRPVPDLPLFLNGDSAVTLPLAAAYAEAWTSMPPDERAGVS